jgi:hypothetical protein
MPASDSLMGRNTLCHCHQRIINTYACYLSDATDLKKTHTSTQTHLFDLNTHTSHKLNGDSPFSIASVYIAYGNQYDVYSWNGILHAIRSGVGSVDSSTSLATVQKRQRSQQVSK